MNSELPSVSVKFKKPRDYSNQYKDVIIFSLPGPYRVSRDVLNSLDKGGVHKFEFKNEDVAAKFAKDLFFELNNILDITTNFKIK